VTGTQQEEEFPVGGVVLKHVLVQAAIYDRVLLAEA
jgi:hypothetical protein